MAVVGLVGRYENGISGGRPGFDTETVTDVFHCRGEQEYLRTEFDARLRCLIGLMGSRRTTSAVNESNPAGYFAGKPDERTSS